MGLCTYFRRTWTPGYDGRGGEIVDPNKAYAYQRRLACGKKILWWLIFLGLIASVIALIVVLTKMSSKGEEKVVKCGQGQTKGFPMPEAAAVSASIENTSTSTIQEIFEEDAVTTSKTTEREEQEPTRTSTISYLGEIATTDSPMTTNASTTLTTTTKVPKKTKRTTTTSTTMMTPTTTSTTTAINDADADDDHESTTYDSEIADFWKQIFHYETDETTTTPTTLTTTTTTTTESSTSTSTITTTPSTTSRPLLSLPLSSFFRQDHKMNVKEGEETLSGFLSFFQGTKAREGLDHQHNHGYVPDVKILCEIQWSKEMGERACRELGYPFVKEMNLRVGVSLKFLHPVTNFPNPNDSEVNDASVNVSDTDTDGESTNISRQWKRTTSWRTRTRKVRNRRFHKNEHSYSSNHHNQLFLLPADMVDIDRYGTANDERKCSSVFLSCYKRLSNYLN